jgi:hypothetical protein
MKSVVAALAAVYFACQVLAEVPKPEEAKAAPPEPLKKAS